MLKRLFFYQFQLILRWDNWINIHVSKAGILVFSLLIASAVFGIDTRQSYAYQLFSLMLSLLLIAAIGIFFQRIPFKAKRHLPRFATLEQTLYYQIDIHNLHKKTAQNLSLHEQLQHTQPDFKSFQHYKKAHPHQSNWFDRQIGYPQWREMIKQQRGAYIADIKLPDIAPKRHSQIQIKLIPLRRGIIYFQDISILKAEPLGLLQSAHKQSLQDSLVILPKRYPMPALKLPKGRRLLPGGISQVMSIGESTEFMSLREYKPGDPWQHIHWKSWARQGKPVVKEFQDEFFVRSALILDTFSQNIPSAHLEAAVSIASSCVERLSHQDNLLDLMFMGNQAHCFTSGRGLGETEDILELLACVQACNDKNIDSLYPLLQQYSEYLSACICVLQTWDKARERLLSYLETARIPYRCFIICADIPTQPLPAHSYYLRHQHLAADLRQIT